jgi:hypothetical protein
MTGSAPPYARNWLEKATRLSHTEAEPTRHLFGDRFRGRFCRLQPLLRRHCGSPRRQHRQLVSLPGPTLPGSNWSAG